MIVIVVLKWRNEHSFSSLDWYRNSTYFERKKLQYNRYLSLHQRISFWYVFFSAHILRICDVCIKEWEKKREIIGMLFFPSEQLHICWNVSYLNEEAKENLTHETVRLLSMKKSKYFVRLFFCTRHLMLNMIDHYVSLYVRIEHYLNLFSRSSQIAFNVQRRKKKPIKWLNIIFTNAKLYRTKKCLSSFISFYIRVFCFGNLFD